MPYGVAVYLRGGKHSTGWQNSYGVAGENGLTSWKGKTCQLFYERPIVLRELWSRSPFLPNRARVQAGYTNVCVAVTLEVVLMAELREAIVSRVVLFSFLTILTIRRA